MAKSKLDKLIDKFTGKSDEPDYQEQFNHLLEEKATELLTAKLEAADQARRSPMPTGNSPGKAADMSNIDGNLLVANTPEGAALRKAVLEHHGKLTPG